MSSASRARYRRSPYILGYWAGEHLVLENYAVGSRLAADPEVVAILQSLGQWGSLSEVSKEHPRFDRKSLERVVAILERHSFLHRSKRRAATATERALSGWSAWLPSAGWFHLATKNVRYGIIEKTERLLREKAAVEPAPPAFKRYRGALLTSLPPPQQGELPRLLRERRTWRQFSNRPVDVASIATLLQLTWGVQRWTDFPGIAPGLPLKTSPSGGARHPIEVYLLARDVKGLASGLFHYAPDRHQLALISRGTARRQIHRYLPRQEWYSGASALFIMTAMFAREQWRYSTPRAYRAVLIEAGHLCQTFCLVATWLGLAPFCTLALADSLIEKDLGIDGVSESVMYVAGVGTRPEGVNWAPVPARFRRASPSAGRVASARSQKRRNSS